MRWAIIAILLFYTLCSNGQTGGVFKIKGSFKNIRESLSTVYLIYEDDESYIKDSSFVKNGKYEFSVPVKDPTLFTIVVKFLSKNKLDKSIEEFKYEGYQFFIEPSRVSITNKNRISNFILSGSVLNKQYQEYLKSTVSRFVPKLNDLQKKLELSYKNGDSSGIREIDDKISSINNDILSLKIEYILKNQSLLISVLAIQEVFRAKRDVDEALKLYSDLSDHIKEVKFAQKFQSSLNSQKLTKVGMKCPDITMADNNGQSFSLSSLRDKYILLEFWASWCIPCRQNFPAIRNIYNLYKEKGFEVIGISLDTDNSKWLQAIKKDTLNWKNISDLKEWGSPVVKMFNINSIPFNVLIDNTGTIISTNISVSELEKYMTKELTK